MIRPDRRRVNRFLWTRLTIGKQSRRFEFVTLIQELREGEWVNIAWDDCDDEIDLYSFADETLPEPSPLPLGREDYTDWGEDQVARGDLSLKRAVPAGACTFATWTINAANHLGFAQAYGRANADRLARSWMACQGMEDPLTEVSGLKARPSTLLAALQSAPPEEVAAALLEASKTRNGLAYDVGMALYQADAGKEVPGPDPYDQFPKSASSGSVVVQDFDPARKDDAIQALRTLWGHTIPTYDENDPKWLKATRAERRAAKSAAENWVKYSRDRVPEMISTIENGRDNPFFSGYARSEFVQGAPRSRAEADLEVIRFATYGVQARVEGFEPPPATHTVSLQDLSRGPTA